MADKPPKIILDGLHCWRTFKHPPHLNEEDPPDTTRCDGSALFIATVNQPDPQEAP